MDEKKCTKDQAPKPKQYRECQGVVCEDGVWVTTHWTKVNLLFLPYYIVLNSFFHKIIIYLLHHFDRIHRF